MTHSGGKPHANIGDRGQRYEVRSTGYPDAKKSVVGWAPTLGSAAKLAKALRQHPDTISTEIFDRQEGKQVVIQFSGVLR